MIRLLFVACMFISNIAFAGNITVTGSGQTLDEAKHQAFRKAIELHIGATVLSDIETQNFNRVKDDIYIYSSGYVDDYKILRQETVNNKIILLLEVSVSESKIKNRIISVGKSSTDFDNNKHAAQINTYVQTKLAGERLLLKHLDGYPKKAYLIKQLPYTISLDKYRNPILNIPYQLSWNYDYIKTLKEILDTIEDGSNGLMKNSEAAIVIMVKDPKDWILGERTTHRFNDLNVVTLFHDSMNGRNQVRIILRLKDIYNNDVAAACYAPYFISGNGAFYNTGPLRVKTIFGNAKEEATISIPTTIALIDKVAKIELSIDADFVCQR